jgi:hypothetical protein
VAAAVWAASDVNSLAVIGVLLNQHHNKYMTMATVVDKKSNNQRIAGGYKIWFVRPDT